MDWKLGGRTCTVGELKGLHDGTTHIANVTVDYPGVTRGSDLQHSKEVTRGLPEGLWNPT